jgi:hypothetical protein
VKKPASLARFDITIKISEALQTRFFFVVVVEYHQ